MLGLSKKILIISLIAFLLLPNFSATARSLVYVSDRISTSLIGMNANHLFRFKVPSGIPAGGRIQIAASTTAINVLPGLDYSDLDLATSSSATGSYTDRELASTSSVTEDGVSVNVSSTTLNSIEITMNSSSGISPDTFIQIEVGTSATYDEIGNRQLVNPIATGTYPFVMQTFDASGKPLDWMRIFIATTQPVYMTISPSRMRGNGKPSGVLTYGTTETLMSLTTNYEASCRYSTATNTPYADMIDDFSYTGAYYHSIMINGLQNGERYTFFVRCQDTFAVDDTTDYVITFEISGQEGEEGEETGVPGPGGGGSGGGGGGGTGPTRGPGTGEYLPYPPEPGAPGVVLSGWSYPLTEVTILKDGVEQGLANANADAEFGAFLADLPQGVYTFSVWGEDPKGKKSSTYSTTFWIDEGTQTTVANIFLSPTMTTSRTSFSSGETIEVIGYSAPGASIETWFYPKQVGNPNEAEVIKDTASVRSDGTWSAFINTSGLDNGSYYLKVHANISGVGNSEFSSIKEISIGGVVDEGECAGADLNGDGLVNITDFSILLYWWNTDNACADQNNDGNVDLIDFSIMMFNWTG